MARLTLTSPGEDVDVGGNVEVIGTRSGGEVITLMRGEIRLDPSFNSGGDTVVLPQASSAYTARLIGSQVEIKSGTLTVLIPVGTEGTDIEFGDVTLELVIDPAAGTVLLGGQVVTQAAQPVDPNAAPPVQGTPATDETGAPNDSVATAQFLDRGEFRVADNGLLEDDALPSMTVSGTLSGLTDNDFYEVALEEGELLILDIDNAEAGLDALIRVFGPDGREITMGDDAPLDPGSDIHPASDQMTLDSRVTFRAPDAGTYTFSVESYRDEETAGSEGDYQLQVSIGDPVSIEQIRAEDIANIVAGPSWFMNDLTYGFPTLGTQYGTDAIDEIADGFEMFSPLQQQAIGQILTQIASVTNLSFTLQTASPGTANLRYAMSDVPETAYAYYPSDGPGGDSWYNNESGEFDAPAPGSYAWATMIHETGHALGLKHGHEAPAVSLFYDSVEYTIMSYRSYPGASTSETEGGYTNERWGYPTTLMMYDIAALQSMYGADFTHNGGNTVYSWDPSRGVMSINGAIQTAPGANRVFLTLWDGAGEDTYDLSRYGSGVEIDLRPGEWSFTSAVQLANLGEGHMAVGNIANALLFEGNESSLIENGIGGAGDDRFIANQVANEFTGGAGRDTFIWHSTEDSAASEADLIVDFARGSDLIDLSAIDADEGVAGNQAFAFLGSGAFTETAGELRFDVAGSTLHLLGDTDGDGAADIQILLANLTAIAAADIHA